MSYQKGQLRLSPVSQCPANSSSRRAGQRHVRLARKRGADARALFCVVHADLDEIAGGAYSDDSPVQRKEQIAASLGQSERRLLLTEAMSLPRSEPTIAATERKDFSIR